MPGKVTWAQSDAFKPASARWARGTGSTCAVPHLSGGQQGRSLCLSHQLSLPVQCLPSPSGPSFPFTAEPHMEGVLASSLHWPLLDFHLPFNSLRPGGGGGGLDTFLQMPRVSKPGCNLAARLENAEAKPSAESRAYSLPT